MITTKRKLKAAYLALDLHSVTTTLGALKEDGTYLGEVQFATTERNLIEQVAAIKAKKKILVIEECPLTHWALGVLRPWCTKVIACYPKQNKWISRSARKDDSIDAEKLCRLLRLGEIKEVYHTREVDRFAFKACVQHYVDVQRDRVRAKAKIKALYARLGMPALTGERVYSTRGRQDYLTEVKSASWRASLLRHYRHYDWLHLEAREALKEMERFGSRYPEIEEFLKIPGVGPVTAHLFSAYVITPHRFATKSKLYRYARLSITGRSSDGKPLGYKRLERDGSPQLKSAPYHAWRGAICAKSDNEVKAFYQAALVRNGGNQKRARLAAQRKILSVMWALWRKGQAYDPLLFTNMNEK